MRYFVFRSEGGFAITLNYGGGSNMNTRTEYGWYKTEQEAIEKCAKLNAMLYPQPYIFIER